VDLAPGAAIELTTGEVVVVESVRHYFGVDPWPGYWNVASAVAPELWGLGAAQPPRSYQLGPYLLVVLDHDDPEGQGRFRGRFMEDPAGYPTPWVICPVSADAGKDTGFYWPPRRGNLALVSASAACPEVLTWHGAVRGREQAVPTAWRDKQRPFVAMMPGRDGFIEFGAPNAFMTLDAQAGESKVYGARRSDVG
jgi:hypothetical protein